jgi:LysR family transcriptional regulator, regulator for metE and metH
MKLTGAGERVLLSARTVLEELNRVERDIESIPVREKVRLTTQCYTVYHWLPSCLVRFMKNFTDVDVKVIVEATANPFEALIEDRVDLAIICSPARDRRIAYTPLFSDEVVALVAPEHPLAQKPYLSAEDFVGENFLVYPPKEESTVIRKLLMPAGLAPRAVHEVTLTEAMIELVKAGLGITVLTRWAVVPQLQEGSLVEVPLTREGLWRDWSVARLKRKSMPAHVQEFLRLLAENPLRLLETRNAALPAGAARRGRRMRSRASGGARTIRGATM